MNTEQKPILERITEAEVGEWMKARLEQIKAEYIPCAETLNYTVHHFSFEEKASIQVYLYGDKIVSDTCSKIQPAVDSLAKLFPNPETVATRKRAEAARLLAEADALSPEPALTIPATVNATTEKP